MQFTWARLTALADHQQHRWHVLAINLVLSQEVKHAPLIPLLFLAASGGYHIMRLPSFISVRLFSCGSGGGLPLVFSGFEEV